MNALYQADLVGYCQTREHDENPPEPVKANKVAPSTKGRRRR